MPRKTLKVSVTETVLKRMHRVKAAIGADDLATLLRQALAVYEAG